MNGIRLLWMQYGLGIVMTVLVLSLAWGLRQTQAAMLVDFYHWVTQLWHPQVTADLILKQASNLELQAQVEELRYQNRELKQLLGFVNQLPGRSLPAPVMGRNLDNWWQQLTLARGQSDGVKVGDIVMAPGGLVGRVEEISDRTSRVLLISDPTSRVGVMLSRTRQMGVLRGTSSQTALLEFFDKAPQVEVKDTVVTSGLSQLYPPGLMVGYVRSINLDASPAPQAEVELTAPLGLLEWGVIYTYGSTATAN